MRMLPFCFDIKEKWQPKFYRLIKVSRYSNGHKYPKQKQRTPNRNYWHTNKDFIASGPALRGQKYVKYVVR